MDYLNKKYAYDLSIARITDLAYRNKVKKKYQNFYSISKVSRIDEYNMAELYNKGYSSNKISKMYGYKTRNSVLQKLDKLGVKRRDCNEIRIKEKSYFNFNMKKIDTEEKAYFLGLLITDGYINKERGYIGIDLTRTASCYNLELLRNNVYNKPFGMMRKYNRLYMKDVQRL